MQPFHSKPAYSIHARDRSGSAWFFVLLTWGCAVLYFDPSLLVLAKAAPRAWVAGALVLWVMCLNGFWLYASYYLVMGVASWWEKRHAHAATRKLSAIDAPGGTTNYVELQSADELGLEATSSTKPQAHSRIVLFYATRNDFREEGVAALLKVDWPQFEVVICDDSTLPEFVARIDAFLAANASTNGPAVRVIRRQQTTGWKAGNINHALRTLERDFDYFAICDCDGIFPENFIRDCLARFPGVDHGEIGVHSTSVEETGETLESAPRLAFVQARQEANPVQEESFGRVCV